MQKELAHSRVLSDQVDRDEAAQRIQITAQLQQLGLQKEQIEDMRQMRAMREFQMKQAQDQAEFERQKFGTSELVDAARRGFIYGGDDEAGNPTAMEFVPHPTKLVEVRRRKATQQELDRQRMLRDTSEISPYEAALAESLRGRMNGPPATPTAAPPAAPQEQVADDSAERRQQFTEPLQIAAHNAAIHPQILMKMQDSLKPLAEALVAKNKKSKEENPSLSSRLTIDRAKAEEELVKTMRFNVGDRGTMLVMRLAAMHGLDEAQAKALAMAYRAHYPPSDGR